jgi:hypothetical protein
MLSAAGLANQSTPLVTATVDKVRGARTINAARAV